MNQELESPTVHGGEYVKGAGRTKADIQERIKLFDNMLSQAIAE